MHAHARWVTDDTTSNPITVLIATDGTDASLLAAHEAVALLPAGAEVRLVAVVDGFHDPQEDAGGFEGPVETFEQAEADYREMIVAAEGGLARTARAFGPRPVHQEIIERSSGSVGARICERADELGAAMIVVGSHGHRAIVDVLLGSVSSYVAHHSRCPVLVIRGHQTDR